MWVHEVVDQRAHAIFVPFVTWSTNPQYLTFPWRTSWKRSQLLGDRDNNPAAPLDLETVSSALATHVPDMVVLDTLPMLSLYLGAFLDMEPSKFKKSTMLSADESLCMPFIYGPGRRSPSTLAC